jgi:hypothetical protein
MCAKTSRLCAQGRFFGAILVSCLCGYCAGGNAHFPGESGVALALFPSAADCASKSRDRQIWTGCRASGEKGCKKACSPGRGCPGGGSVCAAPWREPGRTGKPPRRALSAPVHPPRPGEIALPFAEKESEAQFRAIARGEGPRADRVQWGSERPLPRRHVPVQDQARQILRRSRTESTPSRSKRSSSSGG